MVQIANISSAPVLFREKGRGGEEGAIVEILPGEAKSVSIDRDDPRVTAHEIAKLIEVGGTPAQAAKAAREKAPEVPPVTE